VQQGIRPALAIYRGSPKYCKAEMPIKPQGMSVLLVDINQANSHVRYCMHEQCFAYASSLCCWRNKKHLQFITGHTTKTKDVILPVGTDRNLYSGQPGVEDLRAKRTQIICREEVVACPDRRLPNICYGRKLCLQGRSDAEHISMPQGSPV